MAGSSDLNIAIVLKAVDLATKDIESVNRAVKALGVEMQRSEYSRAADHIRNFGQAVKGLTQPLAEVAKLNLSVGAAITAVGAALAGSVFNAAARYEAALADLGKVMDGGIETAKQYTGQLDDLAKAYAQNGQDLVGSMANFVQAGYDAQEALLLVEESAKLMLVGELEATEASGNLVAILKGFEAPAESAAHAVDMLNEVSNKYATDVRQLAQGMADLSPIAKLMGFSMDETAGLLTPIIEVFRSGSEAADGLKTGLLRLTDDSKPVSDALAAIGVSQTDTNGSMRSGKDIFLDVAKAFQTLDANSKTYLTTQLAGIDQSGRMAKVFDNLSLYTEIAAVGMNAAGSAANEVAVKLDTADAAIQRYNQSWAQLARTLGNTTKEEFKGLTNAVTALIYAFDDTARRGGLDPLIQALRPQIESISALFNAIAENLETALSRVDWSPLVQGLSSLSQRLGDAFAKLVNVDLTTVDGLQQLLQQIINLAGNFAFSLSGVVDGIGPLLTSLNWLFEYLTQNRTETLEFIGQLEGLALSFNVITPIVADFASRIFSGIGVLADFVLKISLAYGAIKLLGVFGIPTTGILTGLLTAIKALIGPLTTAALNITGLGKAFGALAPVAVGMISYDIGGWLRKWIIEAQAAGAESTTLQRVLGGLASAMGITATEAEQAGMDMEFARAKTDAMLRTISERTGVAVHSMQELNQAVQDGKLIVNETTGEYERGAQAIANTANTINNEIANAKRDSMNRTQADHLRHIRIVNEQEAERLKKVRDVEEQIRQLKMDAESRIRELQRQSMTEYDAYQDRRRQIAELTAKAEAAIAAGQYQVAQDLAKQIEGLAQQQARGVKAADEKRATSAKQTAAAVAGSYSEETQAAEAAAARKQQIAETDAQVTRLLQEGRLAEARALHESLQAYENATATEAERAAKYRATAYRLADEGRLNDAKKFLQAAIDIENDVAKAALTGAKQTTEAVSQVSEARKLDLQIMQVQREMERAQGEGRVKEAQAYAQTLADLEARKARAAQDGATGVISAQQGVAEAVNAVSTAAKLQEQALAASLKAQTAGAQEVAGATQTIAPAINSATTAAQGMAAPLGSAAGAAGELNTQLQTTTDALTKLGSTPTEVTVTILPPDLTPLNDVLTPLKETPTEHQIVGKPEMSAVKTEIETLKQPTEHVHTVRPETKEARDAIDKLKKPTESKHTVKIDAKDALETIKLLKKNTSSTHTVHVKTANTGGLMTDSAQALASGGMVFRPFSGARVPGTGNRDTFPALLRAGSFVLRKPISELLPRGFADGGWVRTLLTPGERVFGPAEVARIGLDRLYAMNGLALGQARQALASMTAPVSRFANGGLVTGGGETLTIDLRSGNQRATVTASRDQAAALASMLRDLQRGL
jgi:TP901 family phage tail tape measure protein